MTQKFLNLDAINDQLSNWSLDQLNSEQSVLRIWQAKHTDFPAFDPMKFCGAPIKGVIESAYILTIRLFETGEVRSFVFGTKDNDLFRTSLVLEIAAIPEGSLVKTENSVYQINGWSDNVHSKSSAWTHFCRLGISGAWPHRPQGIYF